MSDYVAVQSMLRSGGPRQSPHQEVKADGKMMVGKIMNDEKYTG